MIRRWLLVAVLALTSCSPNVTSTRSPAHQLVLGEVYLQSLDAETADQVDWHQIDVDSPGRLTIRLEFESRDAPVGRIEVHDANTNQLLGVDLLAFGNIWQVDATPGQYFVKIELESGAMTYRIMASLAPP